MESWENKTLADQLNSLQNLPADYMPDLLSKWEIVEAGLPAPKKRLLVPLLVRWSVAAAVLVGIFLWWVNDRGKSKRTIGPFVQQVLVQQQPVWQKQAPTIATPEVITVHSPQKGTLVTAKKNTTQSSSRNNGPTRLQSTMVLKTEQPAILLTDTIDRVDNATSISTVDWVSTSSAKEVKITRKKIYQRDFNDGVLVTDTGFTPSSRQHFSIQLNPFRKIMNDGESPARRLQLKQAL